MDSSQPLRLGDEAKVVVGYGHLGDGNLHLNVVTVIRNVVAAARFVVSTRLSCETTSNRTGTRRRFSTQLNHGYLNRYIATLLFFFASP